MAVLRELNGHQRFRLRDQVTLIGRSPACDVVIPRGQVSARHAQIVHSGAAYYIEDLNSLNGTRVNGRWLRQRAPLNFGDRIEIPGLAVRFCADDATNTTSEQRTLRAAELLAVKPPPNVVSSLDVAGGGRVELAPEGKLRAVLEISKNLGTALDLKDVLPKILESLFTIFPQADRGFILMRDPSTGQLEPRAVRHRRETPSEPLSFSRTIVNYALCTGRATLSADAGSDERFGISQSIQQLQLHSMMCVPMLSQDGTGLGVIQIDTFDKRNQFRQEDLDVLVSASTQAARTVELTQLHQELRDLEAASQIQQSFLPQERPHIEGLQFFDYYSPARHVGGDYYDYIPLPGKRLAVALGDVSGKGVPAALLMARLSAAVRFCLATAPRVAEAVRQLSATLTQTGTEDHFVTFVVAVLDLTKFSMTLVNAGHMPPIRRMAAGPVEDVGAPRVGLPLAVSDEPYEETVLPIERGDTFILYTDGVTEARNPVGEFYGVDRLRTVIQSAPRDVKALGQNILAGVWEFGSDRPQSDDLAVVCFGREQGDPSV